MIYINKFSRPNLRIASNAVVMIIYFAPVLTVRNIASQLNKLYNISQFRVSSRDGIKMGLKNEHSACTRVTVYCTIFIQGKSSTRRMG